MFADGFAFMMVSYFSLADLRGGYRQLLAYPLNSTSRPLGSRVSGRPPFPSFGRFGV